MVDNKIIYQVDAFSDQLYKGNPAGVMVVAEFLDRDEMQNIATEMNLSETAFVVPLGSAFKIRYFTPIKEVPLCGHATLASAHIIYELGLKSITEDIIFETEQETLIVSKKGNQLSMILPEYAYQAIDIPYDFKDLVGFNPIEMYSSFNNWIIAISRTETEILEAKPRFDLLISAGLGHLMITSECISGKADFVVRCFAPMMGVNEDPVTGSAHCVLTPLWSKKLNKKNMKSIQLSKRRGYLDVSLLNDKVEIRGKAITFFRAELN